MGRNGGGWAHYVGQEKCRPITGWVSLANALDWSRPPRTMTGTVVLVHAHRPVALRRLRRPTRSPHRWPRATSTGMHTADTIAQSARLGWMPFYPQFDRNPLDLADEARPRRQPARPPIAATYVANALTDGTLEFADRRRRRTRELAAHADRCGGRT